MISTVAPMSETKIKKMYICINFIKPDSNGLGLAWSIGVTVTEVTASLILGVLEAARNTVEPEFIPFFFSPIIHS